jgi:glucose-6-phosphate isomerase
MKDLINELGLEVRLKDDFKLELDIRLLGGEFSARSLADLKEVLKDKIPVSDDPLYYMYRDVRQRKDDEVIRNSNLRFDLTVILPRMIGSEFNKTLGHYHPPKDGTGISYPEVYEVISGKALYLLQKPGIKEREIVSCYLLTVNQGEKAIMPPNFGHITINPLAEPLVMSNWVASEFSSIYDEIKENQGGVYYICKNNKQDENSDFQIIKNKQYSKIPRLIMARPRELPQFGLFFGKPMYKSGTKDINRLDYLNNPENCSEEIKPENIFDIK